MFRVAAARSVAIPVPASYSVDLARGSAGPWSVMKTTQVDCVESRLGQGVEQPADRGVGDRDRPVEVGQILPDVGGVGQVVGHHDVGGVGRFVAFARIGPVRFEEARGQQERRRLGRARRASGWPARRRIRSRSSTRRIRRSRASPGTTSRAAYRKALCTSLIRTGCGAACGRRRGTPSRGGPGRPGRCSAGSGR